MGSELSQISKLECCPGKATDIILKKPQPRLHTSTSLKLDEEARLHRLITPKRKGTPLRKQPKLCAIPVTKHSSSPSHSFISEDPTSCADSSPSISHTLSIPKPQYLSIQIPQSFTTSADDKFQEAVIHTAPPSKPNPNHHPKSQYALQGYPIPPNHTEYADLEHGYPMTDLYPKSSTETEDTYKFGGPIFEILSPSVHSCSSVTPITTNWNYCATSPSIDPQSAPTPSAYSTNTNHAHFPAYPSTHISTTDIASCCTKDTDDEEEDVECLYVEETPTTRVYVSEDDDPCLYASEAHRVENCLAVQRIIDALQWYAVNGDNHETVYEKMKQQRYGKQLLDDYNHIMECHLEDAKAEGANVEMIRDYNWICAEVDKYVEPCSAAQCTGHRRYLRWKHCANVHRAQTEKQYQIQTYVNTMDGIHCCFLHLAKAHDQ